MLQCQNNQRSLVAHAERVIEVVEESAIAKELEDEREHEEEVAVENTNAPDAEIVVDDEDVNFNLLNNFVK